MNVRESEERTEGVEETGRTKKRCGRRRVVPLWGGNGVELEGGREGGNEGGGHQQGENGGMGGVMRNVASDLRFKLGATGGRQAWWKRGKTGRGY